MDSAIITKENMDQTMVTDPVEADDDDIISFKPQEISTTSTKEEADPFKAGIHLSETPIKESESELKSTAETASSSQEVAENQESEIKGSHSVAAVDASSEQSIFDEPEKCFSQAGPSGEESATGMEGARVESKVNMDPFKPSCELGNSPEKKLGCSASGDNDSASKPDILLPASSEQTTESENERTPSISVKEGAESLEASQQLVEGTDGGEGLMTSAADRLETTCDPCESKAQLDNSTNKFLMETAVPASTSHSDSARSAQQSDIEEVALQANMQVVNVPGGQKLPDASEENPSKSHTHVVNMPGKFGSADNPDQGGELSTASDEVARHDMLPEPFEPKTQLADSLAKCADITGEFDPFMPKQQLLNSPNKVIDTGSSSSKLQQQLPNSMGEVDMFSETEPFNSVEKLTSSDKVHLTKSSDDFSHDGKGPDCVQATTAATSFIVEALTAEEEHPDKPRQQLANATVRSSDDAAAEMDPFKPKTQLVNSPDKSTDSHSVSVLKLSINPPPDRPSHTDLDPVIPETDPIENVEISKENEDLLTRKNQLANLTEQQAEEFALVDPFKPKAQLPNSPDKLDDLVDPFKPKAQLPNSPDKLDSPVGPFKPKAQLPNSPDKLGDLVDPFKPKAQLPDSPDKLGDLADPFKPKAQIPSSPDKSDDLVDPFKPKAQLPNSPDKLNDLVDPFKSKAQLPNSPDKLDDLVDLSLIHI